jgi:hypothetical protein
MNSQNRNLLTLGIVGTAAYLMLGSSSVKGATMAENNEIYDYLIYKIGDTTYAKNGNTGLIDYSGIDAYTVISNTYSAAAQNSYIFIKPGIYDFGNNTLIMNRLMDGFILEMSPMAKITGSGTSSLFVIDSNVRSKFIFGSLIGGSANPASGSPLIHVQPTTLTTTSETVMTMSDLEINELYNGYEGIRIDTIIGNFTANRIKINHISETVNTGVRITDVPINKIVDGNNWDINYIRYPGNNHYGIGIYDGTGQNSANIFRVNSLDGTLGTNQNGTGLYSNASYNIYIIGSTISGDPALNFSSISRENIIQVGFNSAKVSGIPLLDQGTNNTLIIGHDGKIKNQLLSGNLKVINSSPFSFPYSGTDTPTGAYTNYYLNLTKEHVPDAQTDMIRIEGENAGSKTLSGIRVVMKSSPTASGNAIRAVMAGVEASGSDDAKALHGTASSTGSGILAGVNAQVVPNSGTGAAYGVFISNTGADITGSHGIGMNDGASKWGTGMLLQSNFLNAGIMIDNKNGSTDFVKFRNGAGNTELFNVKANGAIKSNTLIGSGNRSLCVGPDGTIIVCP